MTTEKPPATATKVAELTDHALSDILRRLPPADLIRAALSCRRWCRLAARCCLSLTRAPPLLGYFFHPTPTPPPPPATALTTPHFPAVFAPLPLDDPAAADGPRISLDFSPDAKRFTIYDVRHGLVLLLPLSPPKKIVPRLLVLDPASRRRAFLPAPPRDTLPNDRWRADRYFVGAALLSRGHPSRLCFEAACLTIDDGRPRLWVASFRDGECTWTARPRAMDVDIEFDPWWFEGRCVHAAGKLYWHICNSSRLLALDPVALELSFLPTPSELGDRFQKYRIGEVPEDGRLCMAAMVEQDLQLWVRSEAPWNDNGWVLEREVSMRRALDSVPGMPRDTFRRHLFTWVSDLDAGRTGNVFLETWGYGRYSFHLKTGKAQRLATPDGLEFGDPIYAYTLAWPPAFLATAEAQDEDGEPAICDRVSLGDDK